MARDCENCKHRVMKVEVGKGTPPEHFWGCECWECEFEPTTKNDLGVDLISRADVLKLMQDNWHAHNGDWAMQESIDAIRELPSITPQEPILDKIRAEIESKCDRINSLASVLSYTSHREIQELLCDIMDLCKVESDEKMENPCTTCSENNWCPGFGCKEANDYFGKGQKNG